MLKKIIFAIRFITHMFHRKQALKMKFNKLQTSHLIFMAYIKPPGLTYNCVRHNLYLASHNKPTTSSLLDHTSSHPHHQYFILIYHIVHCPINCRPYCSLLERVTVTIFGPNLERCTQTGCSYTMMLPSVSLKSHN